MARDEINRVYDELLVTLARTGNRRAGERLAARWYPRLLRTARRILRDGDLAEDVVQDAWAGICRGWLGLRDPAKFPAWAFGILARKCADAQKRLIRRRIQTRRLAEAAPARGAERGETLRALDQAFATLPQDQRVTAILFFGEGLTLSEIATATGVPAGTVKSRIFYARRQLKAALEGVNI